MFMRVKLKSLFDREIKVCYDTQVLKHGINIKTMCSNYILLYIFRNTKSHLCYVNIGAWAKIETVIKNHVC